MNELAEMKIIVKNLEARVEKLYTLMPKWFSLADISQELGKSRDTIRKYLKSNFEPDVDFKKIGAKIYVSKDALFLVRKHYEK